VSRGPNRRVDQAEAVVDAFHDCDSQAESPVPRWAAAAVLQPMPSRNTSATSMQGFAATIRVAEAIASALGRYA
jgi:hypothetical protein